MKTLSMIALYFVVGYWLYWLAFEGGIAGEDFNLRVGATILIFGSNILRLSHEVK